MLIMKLKKMEIWELANSKDLLGLMLQLRLMNVSRRFWGCFLFVYFHFGGDFGNAFLSIELPSYGGLILLMQVNILQE